MPEEAPVIITTLFCMNIILPEGDGRTELLVQRGGTNLLAALLYFGIMCLLQVAILYMAGPSAIQYLMTMAGA